MSLHSWLRSLRARSVRNTARRVVPVPQANRLAELLEPRCLLAVTPLIVNNTDLLVQLESSDNVVIQANPSGNLEVLSNGSLVIATPTIAVNTLTSISVFGGDGPNRIDLTNVTTAAFAATLTVTVNGGDGSDTILGSEFADSLIGGNGADSVTGALADDTLEGGNGIDTLAGGVGNDSLFGGDGADSIHGDTGNDTVVAGNGADQVFGDAGLDSLNGGDGSDTLSGDADEDTLSGDNGNDSLLGGTENDVISGGNENDFAAGGDGNDTITGNSGNDTLNGDAGLDSLDGNDGNDSLSGGTESDTLNGGAGNDTASGDDGADTIFGGSGNDMLLGRGGDDSISGQAGNDSIFGGSGADLLNGDAGNDLLEAVEPEVSVNDVTVTEGDSGSQNAVFTVKLSSASNQTVTVRFATSNGTAVQPVDYEMVDTVVTFAPGVTTQTVNVRVFGDVTIEAHEIFFVNLSNAVNAGIFDGLGQGTILDNDNPGPGVTIGTNFTGSTSAVSGFIPPDTVGAVGPNHIVEILNGRYAIYDKATGALLFGSTLDAFWQSTGVAGPFGTFDSRIIWDPTANRFIASAENGGNGNSIFIGISNTADPTAGFRGLRFVADSSGQAFNDYPTMSVDADGVYLATNNFGAGFSVSIYSIPKADLLLPVPTLANLTRFEFLNAGQFGNSIQAALDFGPSDGRAAILSAPGGNSLIRTNILGARGPGATLQPPTTITVPNYQGGPLGRQPGGFQSLENVSPRFTGNVIEVGNSLWATHAVLNPATGNSAIRWYEIDETTNAVLQTGLLSDATLDFLDPSIAVNPFGAVVIGATGTGLTTFPSTFAFAGQTTAGVTTFSLPILLHAGASSYALGGARNRWGDYSATQLDPTNPFSFWTFQEFAVANNRWGIQITQVLIGPIAPPNPPPPPPGGTSNDSLNGGDGNDTLIGGDGADSLNGNAGNDSMVGGLGNDSMQGGAGIDTLDGGGGDDTLDGQGGNDRIAGGDGSDTYLWNGNGDGVDTLSSISGYDRVRVQGTDAANNYVVSQVSGQLQITDGTAVLNVSPVIQVVDIFAGLGNDRITINALDRVRTATILTVNGEDGDDKINSNGANLGFVRVSLIGGLGDDTLIGGSGIDSLDGGDGDDSLNGQGGNDLLLGGIGDDIIVAGTGNDRVLGGDGNDNIDAGAGDDLVVGDVGADTIAGGDGNDTLDGGDGTDTINGGSGNDSILGGNEVDNLNGSTGNDTVRGGASDDIIIGENGNDSLYGEDGNDSILGYDGDDTINGGDGDDTIDAGNGNDLVAGGNGDDLMNGAAGNDTLTGGDGNDTIAGGAGNDVLLGDEGDDSLNGQGSTDIINPGEGANTVLDPITEIDTTFVLSAALLAALA